LPVPSVDTSLPDFVVPSNFSVIVCSLAANGYLPHGMRFAGFCPGISE
jgi:hypothetical protein